jgi:phosphatidylglycerophosphatase A
LILAVTVILIRGGRLPDFARRFGGGKFKVGQRIIEALTFWNQTVDIRGPKNDGSGAAAPRGFRAALWLAEGFGVGRAPVAPGTFGSVAGLIWLALLLAPGRLWVYLTGLVAGFFLSVWCCGVAEKLLGKTDPGSVVLDEIVAVPLCFATWAGLSYFKSGDLPSPGSLLSSSSWLSTLAVFVLFRFFDIVKPWPVRQSQSLPGGWGITIDDTLAAVYVNFVAGVVLILNLLFAK